MEVDSLAIACRILDELANTPGLSPAAKAVYLVAMMVQPRSVRDLATRLSVSPNPLKWHCRELELRGWLRLTGEGRRVRPEAVLPREVEAALASEVRRLISLSPFKGEAATKVFVEWVVAPTVRLVFHARPDSLCNDKTGENLEYDIFAPDYDWATEYHGDQHFGPTTKYPGEKAFIERHQRDLLKLSLSRRNNVRLSIVTCQDLRLEGVCGLSPRTYLGEPLTPRGRSS